MVRCPDGYCCQGNETCSAIDSCNTGRTGTLCGSCKENLTESVFTPEYVLTESCKSDLVATLFISAALLYAVVLLSISSFKNMFSFFVKKACIICKERCGQDKGKAKNTKKQSSVIDEKIDKGGLKYMQILFYYVQDSKLFTIYLPEVDANNKNLVVKILEFSPGLLAAYIEATELCFVISSAIVKVTFQLIFRFLVMLFLCLMYFIQKILSHYFKKQIIFKKMKVKLLEAFLLTVLVSYKKLLTGTFILVQC